MIKAPPLDVVSKICVYRHEDVVRYVSFIKDSIKIENDDDVEVFLNDLKRRLKEEGVNDFDERVDFYTVRYLMNLIMELDGCDKIFVDKNGSLVEFKLEDYV